MFNALPLTPWIAQTGTDFRMIFHQTGKDEGYPVRLSAEPETAKELFPLKIIIIIIIILVNNKGLKIKGFQVESRLTI